MHYLLIEELGSGCGTAVERTPRDQVVMGSYSAGPFSLSNYKLWSLNLP